MAGLKIYACSGIGNTQGDMRYWSDNTDIAANTQAVNSLLSRINLTYAEATCLGISDNEKIAKLNKIDLYTVCLQAAYRYEDDPVELHQAGEIIGGMVHEGLFNNVSLNIKKRDTHLDKLLQIADDRMQSYDLMKQADTLPTTDPEFMQWYFDTVELRNKVGLTKKQRLAGKEALQEVAVKGIGVTDGWKEDASVSDYLLNASDYFLYLFFTEDQINEMPYQYKVKRRFQKQVYNNCKGVFTKLYGTEDEMLNIIRTGIIANDGGQPEDICAELYRIDGKGEKAVGVVWTAPLIVALLFAIGGLLASLVKLVEGIINYCIRTDEARYAAVDQSLIGDNAPSANDIESQRAIDEYKAQKAREQMKSWIAPIAIGLAGFYLLFKK